MSEMTLKVTGPLKSPETSLFDRHTRRGVLDRYTQESTVWTSYNALSGGREGTITDTRAVVSTNIVACSAMQA